MKKLVFVALVVLLTGCSSQKANESKDQEESATNSTSVKKVLAIIILVQNQALAPK